MKLKFIFILLLFVHLIYNNSNANNPDEILSGMSMDGNSGTDFYCSFIPTWQQTGKGDVWIYVYSKVRTKVTIEVSGKNFNASKYTEPYKITKFIISTAIVQPYKKNKEEIPLIDQVFVGGGVHIYSDDPIICYGMTNDGNSSEGFLILPVQALGNEYIVASYQDHSTYTSEHLPSYTAIVGAYDKTSVEFTMGGNDWSKTASGQKPGVKTSWNIGKGDVLLFAGAGPHSDLTGSRIVASKPVAVVSGHYCAKVPQTCTLCDILEEMESPTKLWGKTYHVPPILNNPENCYIKIFAKEKDTKIYKDNQQIGFIKSCGGIEGTGYLHIRVDEGKARSVLISADKPISVTQYNPGRTDKNPTEAFQFTLSPVEQFQKEISFQVPGTGNITDFPTNYLLLIYQATEFGTMPEYLEIGEYVNNKFDFKKVSDIYGSDAYPFELDQLGRKFSAKTIQLPGTGVYKIRNSTPLMGYIYSSGSRTYGFAASMGNKDLTKEDNLPPVPTWFMDSTGSGDVNSDMKKYGVIDKPDDPTNRSNIGAIFLHSDLSYNYELIVDDFIPCQESKVSWGLKRIDKNEDALACLTFVDCSGNDTTLILNYYATKISLIEESWDAGLHSVGDTSWKMFHVVNNGTGVYNLYNLYLKNKDLKDDNQGFDIYDEYKCGPMSFPIQIESGDSLHFWVKFTATKEGKFWDSIGYGNSYQFNFQAYISASVGMPVIQVSDWNFPATIVNNSAFGQFDIRNVGTVDLEIIGYEGLTQICSDNNKKIYKSSDLEERNISEANKLILTPQQVITMNLQFTPDDSISYPDEIRFLSNSIKRYPNGDLVDSVCGLSGKGVIPIDVKDILEAQIKIYPNPAEDEINIENIPRGINQIQIFDVFGRELYYYHGIQEVMNISTDMFSQGSYFIKISNSNYVFIKKLMILK